MMGVFKVLRQLLLAIKFVPAEIAEKFFLLTFLLQVNLKFVSTVKIIDKTQVNYAILPFACARLHCIAV